MNIGQMAIEEIRASKNEWLSQFNAEQRRRVEKAIDKLARYEVAKLQSPDEALHYDAAIAHVKNTLQSEAAFAAAEIERHTNETLARVFRSLLSVGISAALAI